MLKNNKVFFFYFCHLKKVVRLETSGPYCVCVFVNPASALSEFPSQMPSSPLIVSKLPADSRIIPVIFCKTPPDSTQDPIYITVYNKLIKNYAER